ncbi:CgeB family protein [Allorhizobium undicola]|uniref:CgeB family protein n=1 Tax=Allorhizobium undicola TaxID=78527 RepID=UPI00048879D7|nr:glycosyltransferase [Allorhizobium undicola]
MRFLFYTHSLVSDWNHGNAHFLRGVMKELLKQGHEAHALEPENGWSRRNLESEHGEAAIAAFQHAFPMLKSQCYGPDFNHEATLAGADVVVVHEWTDPDLVARIGRARREEDFTLLFHDTHHRAVSAGEDMAALELADYDAVLAFGEALSERYRKAGWGRKVFTWHEAADDTLFHPMPEMERQGDLVWIGNWGDDERSRELAEFLLEPVARLSRERAVPVQADIHGVRYPALALDALGAAGLAYHGWIANAEVPHCFAAHAFTIHVPRRPYVDHLPGIPTIRVFEALACGIPLLSAPWNDCEGLFTPGKDFLFARNSGEMARLMEDLLQDAAMRQAFAAEGLATIRARHTCRHRVLELLDILSSLGVDRRSLSLQAGEAAE